jgi:hypothetical protein
MNQKAMLGESCRSRYTCQLTAGREPDDLSPISEKDSSSLYATQPDGLHPVEVLFRPEREANHTIHSDL